MKPIFQKNLQFGDIWPRNCQKIAQIEVFGHFLNFASLVFLDIAHNDRWAWCLVVFLNFADPVNVFLLFHISNYALTRNRFLLHVSNHALKDTPFLWTTPFFIPDLSHLWSREFSGWTLPSSYRLNPLLVFGCWMISVTWSINFDMDFSFFVGLNSFCKSSAVWPQTF